MLGIDEANEFERKGLIGDLTRLPIIEKLIRKYRNYSSKGDLVSLVTKVEPNILYIYDVCIRVMEDGTLRIQEKDSKEISITDKTGVEVERILEVTDKGERRLVRQDGVIREVVYSDQGVKPVTYEVFLDNGDIELKNAKGARIKDKVGEPVYFNAEDALKTFDENMLLLRNGTREQQIYYREARRKLEEVIQDEKISRLPINERIVALKELKADLADEYADLCDFIELDLAEHRNDLSLIKGIHSLKWKYEPTKIIEAYRNKVTEVRKGLFYSTEFDTEKTNIKSTGFVEELPEKEEERLLREIYDYRKRNKELRQRRDVTTEIIEAMEPVRKTIFDDNLPKGIFVTSILNKYTRKREKIVQDRKDKEECIRKRKVARKKQIAERKAKSEFDKKLEERKKRERIVTTTQADKEREKGKQSGKFYTFNGKG